MHHTRPFSLRSVALPLAVAIVTACADPIESSDQSMGALMLGEWSYARHLHAPPDPPSLGAGVSVSIVIDSARAMRFWGHVARWFVGDVGLPANRFGPVSGDIESGRGVIVRLAPGTTQEAWETLTIQGVVNGDLLIVDSSWTAVDAGPFPPGCSFRRLR